MKLTEVSSMDDFRKGENVYFYDAAPNLNKFATKGSEFEKKVITKNPQVLVKLAATDTVSYTHLDVYKRQGYIRYVLLSDMLFLR